MKRAPLPCGLRGFDVLLTCRNVLVGMFTISDRTTTTTYVLTTFDSLGIKPPTDVATAFLRAEKLTQESMNLGARPGDLDAAVTAAILGGREPAADPEVQRVTTATLLAGNVGLPDAVAGAALDVIRSACLAHLDEIVDAWRKPFDEAAATLTEAHKRIGDLSLDDTGTIVARGGDIADVWAKAKSAEQVIDQVVSGWSHLMTLVRVSIDGEHPPPQAGRTHQRDVGHLPRQAQRVGRRARRTHPRPSHPRRVPDTGGPHPAVHRSRADSSPTDDRPPAESHAGLGLAHQHGGRPMSTPGGGDPRGCHGDCGP